jgi:hypothetical protein
MVKPWPLLAASQSARPGPSSSAGAASELPARTELARTRPDRSRSASNCGWFDSSHELQRGLLVCEHADADTLAGDLGLVTWLQWYESGRRGTGASHARQAGEASSGP